MSENKGVHWGYFTPISGDFPAFLGRIRLLFISILLEIPMKFAQDFWERYSRGNYIMGIEGAWGRAHPLNATEISWGNKALYFGIIKGSWWLIIL